MTLVNTFKQTYKPVTSGRPTQLLYGLSFKILPLEHVLGNRNKEYIY